MATIRSTALAAAVAATLSGAPFFAVTAQAQDACGAERGVTAGTTDQAVYNRMTKAYELVGEEQYSEAKDIFVQLRNRATSDYSKSVLAQAIAQVNWQMEDYDAALKEFETAVELDALPDQQHYALMYQIAQLYYSKERYSEALERLDLWFCRVPEEKHTAAAYVLQGSIYAQREDWRNVVTSMGKAISMSPDPKEPWYQLKLAAHFQLEQFPEAADTLEVLISKWPDKKVYWNQLSNTYYRIGNNAKALSVIALAYRKGLLDKQPDMLYLANLYASQDVPFKAAQVLQTELEAGVIAPEERYWTMAGDNWYAAEEYERALAAFAQSGKLADDGKIDMRRAYILVDMERGEEGAAALQAALDKGGLKERETGDAHLLMGMTEFQRGNYERATAAWNRAARFPGARGQAQQWQAHMREERARTGL